MNKAITVFFRTLKIAPSAAIDCSTLSIKGLKSLNTATKDKKAPTIKVTIKIIGFASSAFIEVITVFTIELTPLPTDLKLESAVIPRVSSVFPTLVFEIPTAFITSG